MLPDASGRIDLGSDFCSALLFLWGILMKSGNKFAIVAAASALAVWAASPRPAAAADLGLIAPASPIAGGCAELVLTCENGREYSMCPIAVSIAGEIVTASLSTGRSHASHVRLVPMGVGYRYAGRGIWLDGFRDQALLHFGKHRQLACTVAPS